MAAPGRVRVGKGWSLSERSANVSAGCSGRKAAGAIAPNPAGCVIPRSAFVGYASVVPERWQLPAPTGRHYNADRGMTTE